MSEVTEAKKRRKKKPADEGAAEPVLLTGDQPLEEAEKRLRDEAYSRLELWQQDCAQYHSTATNCRKVFRLQDPEQDPPGTEPQRKALQLQTLKSTIENCVADQMDNMPEALMLPERPELQDVATDMTDVVRFVLDQNSYEEYHHDRAEDFYVAGTAVTQVVWDDLMDNGNGNIAVVRYPIESMVWDPLAEDIQDARALLKLSWHPLSWYTEHYPDQAQYVGDDSQQHNNVAVPESALTLVDQHEGKAMLIEYWYRRFDAEKKKYTINVAYLAGGALLEDYTDVYAHGKYPFVFDAFSKIPGQPVGESMVYALTPMMRYINRYAHYIDENLRFSSKSRMLAREGSGIDTGALADWSKNIVTGKSISEDDVRWFDTKPLSGMATQQMLQFQNDMKMDSGQNQFSRGEVTGGITAAAAISALQESGSKITRMRTSQLSAGFKKIVEQIMWLVAEFYTEDRKRLVIGENMQTREVNMNAVHLMDPGKQAGTTMPPPYTVQIQVQRRNPMRVQAQNDLMIQAYTMAAEAGTPMPLSVLFKLLQIDGKDRLMPTLEEIDQTAAQMQQLAAENEQLKAQNDNLNTTLDSYANALANDVEDLQGSAFGGSEGSENAALGAMA